LRFFCDVRKDQEKNRRTHKNIQWLVALVVIGVMVVIVSSSNYIELFPLQIEIVVIKVN